MKKSTIGLGAGGFILLSALIAGNNESKDNKSEKIETVITSKYINTDIANIREDPNGKVIAKRQRGDKVDIYQNDSGWVRISTGNKNEWVSEKLLCELDNCFRKKENNQNETIQKASSNSTKVSNPTPKKISLDSCSCSVVDYCVGPRGGHYCITSGGNKRYLKK